MFEIKKNLPKIVKVYHNMLNVPKCMKYTTRAQMSKRKRLKMYLNVSKQTQNIYSAKKARFYFFVLTWKVS